MHIVIFKLIIKITISPSLDRGWFKTGKNFSCLDSFLVISLIIWFLNCSLKLVILRYSLNFSIFLFVCYYKYYFLRLIFGMLTTLDGSFHTPGQGIGRSLLKIFSYKCPSTVLLIFCSSFLCLTAMFHCLSFSLSPWT